MRYPADSFRQLVRHAARIVLLPLCALVWHSAGAQTAAAPAAQPTAQPVAEPAANPAAKVPAVPYRSVFKETSLGVEKDTDDWRKANNEVGKFLRGHVDILKWEEQENAKAKAAPAKPAAAPAPQPAAPAHKH